MNDARIAAITRHLSPGEKLLHRAEGAMAASWRDVAVIVGLPLGFVIVMSTLAISGISLGPPQAEAGIMVGFFVCCGALIYALRRRFVLVLTNARVLVIAPARFGGDGSRELAAFPIDKALSIRLSVVGRRTLVTVTGAGKPFSGAIDTAEASAAILAMIDELGRR